jgi:hypothetical protein
MEMFILNKIEDIMANSRYNLIGLYNITKVINGKMRTPKYIELEILDNFLLFLIIQYLVVFSFFIKLLFNIL